MREYKKEILIIIGFIGTGICAGAFYEVNMVGTGKESLIDMLNSFFQDNSIQFILSDFILSILKDFLIIVIIFASGFFMPLCPIALLSFSLLGIYIGFTASMIIEGFGMKGAIYILLSLFPYSFMHLFVLGFLEVLALSSAAFKHHCSFNRNKKELSVYFALGFGILITSEVLRGFLFQAVPWP